MWFLFLKLSLSYTNKLILRNHVPILWCLVSTVEHVQASGQTYLNYEITGDWVTCSTVFNSCILKWSIVLSVFWPWTCQKWQWNTAILSSPYWQKLYNAGHSKRKNVLWDLCGVLSLVLVFLPLFKDLIHILKYQLFRILSWKLPFNWDEI